MIDSIWIKSFRSLSELSLSFSKGSMISIVAKNNVGKTSVLEACYILGHLSSFVSNELSQVIPFDGDTSYLGIKLYRDTMPFNYYMKIGLEGKKYINLNQRSVKKKSDIQSLFRATYISSDSLLLITSQPSFRRKQLDHSLSQFSLSYRKNLATYKRLVQQKNRLIKDHGPDHLIKQLNSQIAPCLNEIQKERLYFLSEIETKVASYFNTLHILDGRFMIHYTSKTSHLTDDDAIIDYLNQHLTKDKMMRSSTIGPHRDDFYFSIDGRNVREFYSRGICRSLAYFYYLSQAQFIESETSLPMLLLLDEPFSEIFKDLKQQLIAHIPSSFSVIYTSTQYDEISNLNRLQLYGINNGTLCKI